MCAPPENALSERVCRAACCSVATHTSVLTCCLRVRARSLVQSLTVKNTFLPPCLPAQELNAGLEEREQRRQQRQLSSVTDLVSLSAIEEGGQHASPSSHPSHTSSHNGSNPSLGRSSKGTSNRDQGSAAAAGGPHTTWGDTLSSWLFGNTGGSTSTAAAGGRGTPRGTSPERGRHHLDVPVPQDLTSLGQGSPPSSLASPTRASRPGSGVMGGVKRSVSGRVARRPSSGAGEELNSGMGGGQEQPKGGAGASQPASGSVTPTRRTALTEEELALVSQVFV
jgi:hypothetical protein